MEMNNIFRELTDALLNLEKPSEYFVSIREKDGYSVRYPELFDLIGVMQNEKHHKEGDVWVHTMMVVDEAAKRRHLVENKLGFMLSALCHDFGKAICSEEIKGVIHAYAHETEGLPLVERFLDRLVADAELKKYVLNMTELHMQPNIRAGVNAKLKSTNKLFDSSAEPFALIQLAICDSLGKIPQTGDSEPFLMERYERYVEIMSRDHVTKSDLLAEGFSDSPMLDKALEYAHKLRLAGCDKDNSMRQTVAYLRQIMRKKGQC